MLFAATIRARSSVGQRLLVRVAESPVKKSRVCICVSE